MPLGFIGCWLGTMLSSEPAAERSFDELYVRSETGLGAEVATGLTLTGGRRRRRGGDDDVPAVALPAQPGRGTTRGSVMEGTTKASAEQIEQELERLLDQEVFEPPAEFRENALISDESVYEEAARDPEAYWAKQAEELLDWAEPWDTVLDESEAPFYKWFVGGKLNASHQALDRHVDAGRGDRVAFHWRGEEGEERDVTYAELLRDTKRLANVLKERGIEPGDVVGIYLPMIPEVVGGDARLRAHRGAAQRRLRRLLARLRQGAHGVLRGQGADHGRPGAPQGQGRRHQAGRRQVPRRRAVDRDRRRGAEHRHRRRR